ncbi:MAG: DUF2148 domain-containing protein [Desulfuromonadales bacterium]|nr:DUF2148 domain-containing protein [Desulfuromonadales bacterium]
MLERDRIAEEPALLAAARQLCVAARTAPKGKGKDLLVTAIVGAEHKEQLQQKMREIGERDGVAFFVRDAGNLDQAPLVVLVGTRKEPLRIPACGFCGFANCDTMLAAGGTCSFNSGDLGIALGSAVALAADLRIDTRIMYSAGKAALELGLLGDGVEIAYAIPLAATGKSPFFDR